KIDYVSEMNKGTTFLIDLPVYSIPELKHPSREMSNTPRILIVEDDIDIATLISMVLKNAGYETDIAYSAEDAKTKMQEQNYSLISLDLLLPKQQGISFIQELRAGKANAEIPIVVVSAVADKKQNELHGGFGIVDWISKPIDMSRLQRAVQETLRSKDSGTKRVLYVEDDDDNIEILEQLLKDRAVLIPAKSITAAKQYIDQEDFHLILLDLSLPDGSGLELIPYLKTTGKPTIPVLIFSAMEAPSDTNKEIVGALVKSKTSNEDLVAIIQQIIDK
ncbi:MAG: response regulator, partial [Candidatus Cloacimonadaceae bacterium]|nr:response regulator [Candidatus Cloacimonadaceae bacterium]